MAVIINGNNTPTAGSVTYGDGSQYANTASGSAGQVLTSAGSSAPVWATPASVNLATGVTGTLPIANGGTNSTATPTAGGVVYGTGTAQAVTTAGTSGQLLQSNGASAPSWVAAPSSAMTLISTATASSSSFIIFTGLNFSTYKQYMVLVSNAVPNNSGYTLYMQMSDDNGATYKTGSTNYYYYSLFLGIASYSNQAANDAGIAFQSPAGTSNSASLGGTNLNVYLNDLTNTNRKAVYSQGFNQDPSYGGAPMFGGGELTIAAGSINAIRFYFNNGRLITSGTFKLYGIT